MATAVERIEKTDGGLRAEPERRRAVRCASLVVATGGKSIPKMGATGFGYDVAAQFGLRSIETRRRWCR